MKLIKELLEAIKLPLKYYIIEVGIEYYTGSNRHSSKEFKVSIDCGTQEAAEAFREKFEGQDGVLSFNDEIAEGISGARSIIQCDMGLSYEEKTDIAQLHSDPKIAAALKAKMDDKDPTYKLRGLQSKPKAKSWPLEMTEEEFMRNVVGWK